MGVDYYVHKIGNVEKALRKEVTNIVKLELDTYHLCGGNSDSTVSGCGAVKTIEEIKSAAISKYFSDLPSQIALVIGSLTKMNITDNSRTYELLNLTSKYIDDNIQFELNILGFLLRRLVSL